MLMPEQNLKEKLLSFEAEKDQENREETSIFTDKRKSITNDNTIYHSGMREIGENVLFFTDGKRRKSASGLPSVAENKSSEKSFASYSATPNNTSLSKAHSSKIYSHEIENILEIKVANYSRITRRNKEKTVNFVIFSFFYFAFSLIFAIFS